MKNTIKAAVALAATGVLALSGCSRDSSGSGTTLNIVGYSVLEQATQGVSDAFKKTDAGKDIDFKESYGASGDQRRAVIAGQKADEVHLSLEPDMTKLTDEKLVADSWKDGDNKGIVTQSVVAIVVR